MPDAQNAIVFATKGVDASDTSNWEYVSLPEKDLFDKPFQGAAINDYRFEHGKTYFMPPDWAAELRRILAAAQKADIRLMQSTPDVKSVKEAYPSAQFFRS